MKKRSAINPGRLSVNPEGPVSDKQLEPKPDISRPAPRVSVVLPTYNHAKFLPHAVRSVLNQTMQNFELIIIDDASTDGTPEYLASITDPRVKTIRHGENQRLPESLNDGFTAASGDLLTWISSDNLCHPRFLEFLADALDAFPQAGLAYSSFAWIDEGGKRLRVTENQDFSLASAIALNPGNASFMYRRAVQERIGPYDPALEGAEDWDMWVRIIDQYPAVYVPEILYDYREHANSMTAQKRDQIESASRQVFLNTVKRLGDSLSLEHLYPEIDQCSDRKNAVAHAAFHFGTLLLRSPFADPSLACTFLKRARQEKPDFLEASCNLAVAYLRRGDREIAEAVARQLAAVDNPAVRELVHGIQIGNSVPSLPVFVLGETRSELLQVRYASRLTYSRTGGRISETTPYEGALALATMGKTSDAIAVLEHLAARDPRRAEVYNDLGALYFSQGEAGKALTSLQHSLEIAPQNETTLKNVAEVYIEIGELEEAVRLYTRILDINGRDIEANMALGTIAAALRREDEAKWFFSRVLECDPGNLEAMQRIESLGEVAGDRSADALKEQAKSLAAAGDLETSEQLFRLIVEQNPRAADAQYNLGICLYAGGNHAEAIAAFRKAFELDPSDTETGKALARALLEAERDEEALRLLVRLLAQSPRDTGILTALAAIYRTVGRDADADRFMSHARDIDPACVEPEAIVSRTEGDEQQASAMGLTFCIITGGKRTDLLRTVMTSIEAQQIPQYEILVIGEFHAGPGYTYIPAEEDARTGRLGAMRNTGMRLARYENVVILDDDIILDPDWYVGVKGYGNQFDILTSQIRVPDGSRYWDHATSGGDRGHMILDASEEDDHVYMTGGGGWIIKKRVWEQQHWDEKLGFYKGEDLDFSQRCTRSGFRISHNHQSVVYHADPVYTTIGRLVFRREVARSAAWVALEHAEHSPEQLGEVALSHLRARRFAEAADCLRYLGLRFPEVANASKGWEALQASMGGGLSDARWCAGDDPRYLETITRFSANPINTKEPVPVQWSCALDFSGYSQLGRECLKAIDRSGEHVALRHIGDASALTRLLEANEVITLKSLTDKSAAQGVAVLLHPPRLWEGTDLFAQFRSAYPDMSAHVGFTMFETDTLPEGWADACNGMDEIWVPSLFNAKTFVESGVDAQRIRVIPCGLDQVPYDPGRVRPMDIPGRRAFAFSSVFQWTRRKGWDVLLKAFCTAFRKEDDVCLVLRAHPGRVRTPSLRERIDTYLQSIGVNPDDAPTIILLEEFIPEKELPALYAASDAFVLPTRGEGWGIPYMEAMLMGLPVIGTRWSGHLDFMNDSNSYLIDVDRVSAVSAEQQDDDPFYTPAHHWAEPSWEHAAELMRRVYADRDGAKEIGRIAREDMRQNWPVQRTASWIQERVAFLGRNRKSMAPASVEHQTTGSVVYHAPVFNPSGYADEARNLVLGLEKIHIPVALRAISAESKTFKEQLDETVRHRLEHSLARNVESPFISVIHFPAYAFQRVQGAAYCIGRTMFESDGLPREWVDACNAMDEIWVPSEFNLKTFRDAGVRSALVKIPGGVDSNLFRPLDELIRIPGARRVVFLSIFEWSYRKGWDVLLRAWAESFAADDDVTLVLRTYEPNNTEGEQSSIQGRIQEFFDANGIRKDDVAPIIILDRQVGDLPRLYAAATAYVAPSRGEGWGRPQMEAMSCGLPVIATRWSGNLEFMNDENSLLIDVEHLARIDERTEIPFYRGQQWAEPSIDHLKTLLKRVAAEPAAVAAIGRRARKDMCDRWSWESASAIAARRIREIRAGIGGRAHSSPSTAAIRWEGAQFVHHSLAAVNRNLCSHLIAAGLQVSVIPTEKNTFSPPKKSRMHGILGRINASFDRVDIHVRHQWPPTLEPPQEGRWVVMQPWEFGSLPRKWAEVFSESVDELWVPSNYVRQVYIESGVPGDRVVVIPNGVDPAIFHPSGKKFKLNTRKRFRFLFVGGTIFRKGIDILLKAYSKAFTGKDDVCLVIKDMCGDSFYKGQTFQEEIHNVMRNPDSPAIEYIDRILDEKDLAALYRACDVLVHPYRGEGFGMPILEAMACGTPPIIPNGGAALDFCTTRNAILVPAAKKRYAEKRINIYETVNYPWLFEIETADLAGSLKRAFEEGEELLRLGKQAAKDAAAWTWEASAEKAASRIEALRTQPVLRECQGEDASLAEDAYAKAIFQLRSKKYREAMTYLDDAERQLRTGTPTPDAITQFDVTMRRGDCLLKLEMLQEAREQYDHALHIDPTSAEACFNLGVCFEVGGQMPQALRMYTTALRLKPSWDSARAKVLSIRQSLEPVLHQTEGES